MANDVLIAVGSNIDPERNIPKALDLLHEQCPISAVSAFYRTRPLDRNDQPEFLNGACRCAADFSPRDLKFGVLRKIEANVGRVRGADPHAPREIDLDIGLMGGLVVDEADLSIPDPDIESRAFLAVPFAELAPDALIPTTGRTLSDLASAFDVTELKKDSAFTEAIQSRYLR